VDQRAAVWKRDVGGAEIVIEELEFRRQIGRAAIPQNAGLRKGATRFKDEALISYLNRSGISSAPNDHMFEQCVVIIAFRTSDTTPSIVRGSI
jgi:hypothetical protein